MNTQISMPRFIRLLKLMARIITLGAAVVFLIFYAIALSTSRSSELRGAHIHMLQLGLPLIIAVIIALRWPLVGGVIGLFLSFNSMILYPELWDIPWYSSLITKLSRIFLVGCFLYFTIGLLEFRTLFRSKGERKYKTVFISAIDTLKNRKWWIGNVLPFTVVYSIIVSLSFSIGMTTGDWSHSYFPQRLNPFLWATHYGGYGAMPWESYSIGSGSNPSIHYGSMSLFIWAFAWWAMLSITIIALGNIIITASNQRAYRAKQPDNAKN